MGFYLLIACIGLGLLFIGFFIGKKMQKLEDANQLKDWEKEMIKWTAAVDNLTQSKNELEQKYALEIRKLETGLKEQITDSKFETDTIRKEKEELHIKLTRSETERFNLLEKINTQKQEIADLQEKFKTEFENMAHAILDKNSTKFTELNKNNIENILLPLQEKIKSFEEKVEKNREALVERHAELGKQLEHLNLQNIKISEEATNLTRALKGDSKTQGNWGEMILERVLELSGLRKDYEYFVQQSFTQENNKRLQPDVIVKLPGDKRIIIDAKVSLKNYEEYINLGENTDKTKLLHLHVNSLKNHINQLGKKNYQDIHHADSPDFVLLFIPIEAAFALASKVYPQLYNEAFEKNIILVTPTTLLAVLKTIDSIWQNEKQQQNAGEIAKKAGKLYDYFVNLLQELEKLGRQLNTVQTTYDGTMKKLTGRGNLIRRVEKLKELGAGSNKKIDPKYLE